MADGRSGADAHACTLFGLPHPPQREETEAMIYVFAARIYLIMVDTGLEFCDAFDWVCHRLDKNLRLYYWQQLSILLDLEGL
jgi:hypothetical protein